MCRSEKVTFVVLAWLVLHERVRERGGWGWGVGSFKDSGPGPANRPLSTFLQAARAASCSIPSLRHWSRFLQLDALILILWLALPRLSDQPAATVRRFYFLFPQQQLVDSIPTGQRWSSALLRRRDKTDRTHIWSEHLLVGDKLNFPLPFFFPLKDWICIWRSIRCISLGGLHFFMRTSLDAKTRPSNAGTRAVRRNHRVGLLSRWLLWFASIGIPLSNRCVCNTISSQAKGGNYVSV